MYYVVRVSRLRILGKPGERQVLAPCRLTPHPAYMAARNVQKKLVRQALGAELARVRKQQGMPRQSHLADATGLGVKTISDIETGRIVPREQTMRRIETALDLPLGQTDEFLGGKIRRLAVEVQQRRPLSQWTRAEAMQRADEIAKESDEDEGMRFMLRWADAVKAAHTARNNDPV